MDLRTLQARVAALAEELGAQEAKDPRELAAALCAEGGTLLAVLRRAGDRLDDLERHEVEQAIGEVMLCAAMLGERLGFDLNDLLGRRLPGSASPESAFAAPPAGVGPAGQPAAQPAPKPAPQAAPQPAPQPAQEPTPEPAPEPAPAPASPPCSPQPMPLKPETSRLEGTDAATPPPAAPVASAAPPAPPRTPSPAAPNRRAASASATAVPAPDEKTAMPPSDTALATAAREVVHSLSRRVDGSPHSDPLIRELHDELETLKRALYSQNPKRRWLEEGLNAVRRLLEEAATQSIGDEIRAAQHLRQIDQALRS